MSSCRSRCLRVPALRATRTVACVVAVLLALPGCSSGGRERHADGQGPLSAQSGRGTTSITAPARSPWYGSFGALVLCRTDPDTQIRLQRVRYVTGPAEPREVTVLLRHVRPGQLTRKGARDRAEDSMPVASAIGFPPRFSGSGRPGDGYTPAGTFTRRISGVPVRQDCGQDETKTGWTELFFVLEVDERGGEIPRAALDYLADGKPYTLRLEWEMIACGRAVSTPPPGSDYCAEERSAASRAAGQD